jgi:hypothetical protein
MFTKNIKTGKKGRAKTKADIGTLSDGSYECDFQIETKRISGYKAGMKNIPALFWNPM